MLKFGTKSCPKIEQLCKFIGKKERLYVAERFNCLRNALGHQHGRCLKVFLENALYWIGSHDITLHYRLWEHMLTYPSPNTTLTLTSLHST